MIRFASTVAVGGMAVGLLAAGPVQAKRPNPPQITARTSVTIPPYACQSAAKWLRVSHSPGTRVDSARVTSVRKKGYTSPISDYTVCGYMGSGTYTLTAKVRWSVSKRGWRRVPVYRYRDVQKPTGEYTPTVWEDRDSPFTCTLDSPSTLNTAFPKGIGIAFYDCVSDDGSEDIGDDEVINLPSSDWTLGNFAYGQLLLHATRNNIPFAEVPPTVTGTATKVFAVAGDEPIYETVSERYLHHYRRKPVFRWVNQRRLTIRRVVQVTVR